MILLVFGTALILFKACLACWPLILGVIITKILRKKKSILLAHYGMLTTGNTVREAAYLAIYLDRAARIRVRAATLGEVQSIDGALVAKARDYLLIPEIVDVTFEYWYRQTILIDKKVQKTK
ncbi:hypothetical protein HD806DRAFT_210458 [Xylariaceae sp. AK1471]|nr:hypothetical protein HD806DRAFT_210458 [Xylariaceae sp. AK1471]